MGKKLAPETRARVLALKSKMARKGAKSLDIVEAFLKQERDVLARETKDLFHIALMKMVSGGHGPSVDRNAVQLELFLEYDLPTIVLIADGAGERVHRIFQTLTFPETRSYVEEKSRPRSRRLKAEVKEIARLLDDLAPFKKSENSTIGECWASLREARGDG